MSTYLVPSLGTDAWLLDEDRRQRFVEHADAVADLLTALNRFRDRIVALGIDDQMIEAVAGGDLSMMWTVELTTPLLNLGLAMKTGCELFVSTAGLVLDHSNPDRQAEGLTD
jgi:hypothetical protein